MNKQPLACCFLILGFSFVANAQDDSYYLDGGTHEPVQNFDNQEPMEQPSSEGESINNDVYTSEGAGLGYDPRVGFEIETREQNEAERNQLESEFNEDDSIEEELVGDSHATIEIDSESYSDDSFSTEKASARGISIDLAANKKLQAAIKQLKKPGKWKISGLSKKSLIEKNKKVQLALNARGEKLGVDGVLGKESKEAIRRYQKKNKLKVTGLVDRPTLKKLGIK